MAWILLALHGAFLLPFLLRLAGIIRPRAVGRRGAAVATDIHANRHASALLIAHGAAFAVFYGGLISALASKSIPSLGTGRALLGTALILLAIGLLTWTLLIFHSWRLRAELDPGHELCTGGPFRLVRHPIYLACALLTLGTAIWVGTPVVWTGTVLVIVGGDLRARAEERVLLQAFGERYRDYMSRSRRLIPNLY